MRHSNRNVGKKESSMQLQSFVQAIENSRGISINHRLSHARINHRSVKLHHFRELERISQPGGKNVKLITTAKAGKHFCRIIRRLFFLDEMFSPCTNTVHECSSHHVFSHMYTMELLQPVGTTLDRNFVFFLFYPVALASLSNSRRKDLFNYEAGETKVLLLLLLFLLLFVSMELYNISFVREFDSFTRIKKVSRPG